MQIRSESGAWQACPGTVLRGSIAQGQHARRQHSGSRSKACALERAWTRKLDRIDRQEKAGRRLAAKVRRELGLDRKDVWGRGLRLRLAPAHRPKRKYQKGGARRTTVRIMPAYKGRIVDRKGRTAVFFRIRYMGLKSPKWRAGCTVDHAYYIMRADALETIEGLGAIVSNMGDDPDEVAGCWKMLEEVERAYRANAKVQYRIIVNVPHELTPEQRLQWLEDYCERQFGRYGLPFVAALHKPDAGGDQRNFHAHICFSTRPVERVGAFEWEVAEEKVTDLARKENLLTMRAEVAAQLNRSCRKAGVERRFTHLSYAARKLDVLPQEHAGPERSAAYRSGDDVKLIAQNGAIMERNEAFHHYRLAELATMSTLCSSLLEWADTGAAAAAKAVAKAIELQHVARLREVAVASAERLKAFNQGAALLHQQHENHRMLVEQARVARRKALVVQGSLRKVNQGMGSISLPHAVVGEPRQSQIATTRSIRAQAQKISVDTVPGLIVKPLKEAGQLARTLAARAKVMPIQVTKPGGESVDLGRSWNTVSQIRHIMIRFARLAGASKPIPPDRFLSRAAGTLRSAAKSMCALHIPIRSALTAAASAGTHTSVAMSCRTMRTMAGAMPTHLVEPTLHVANRAAGEKLAAIRKEAQMALSSYREDDIASEVGQLAIHPTKKSSGTNVAQGGSEVRVTAEPKIKSNVGQRAGEQIETSMPARVGIGPDAWQALTDGRSAQER